MSESAESHQTYAITSVEQSATLLPWRYTQAQWEPVDVRHITWLPRALVAVLLTCVLSYGFFAAWQYAPRAMGGQVSSVVSGRLLVQDGEGGPWMLAGPGRSVRHGARLQAEPGTIATLAFADGSMMRIESGGEWVVDRVASSLNTRLKRVRIKHLGGVASYASAPRQSGVSGQLVVDAYGVRLRLRGVATVTEDGDERHAVSLWQGVGRLSGFGQRIDGQAGDLFHSSSVDRVLGLETGVLSR